MFWLKKSVSYWLMPVPLSLALIASGFLISRLTRRSAFGRTLFAAGTALLLFFSNKAVSYALLGPLEGRYPAIPEFAQGMVVPAPIARCRFVVVLGGGHSDVAGLPATSQLSSSALGRVVEAVRILRAIPEAGMIVSGPGEPGRPSHAAILARAAGSLGVDRARISLIETALDTEDEAAAISARVGKSPIALVTSAGHMPRAALLFKEAGVDFVPCPSDFAARGGIQLRRFALTWDSESLERSTRAMHEWLGLLWLKVR